MARWHRCSALLLLLWGCAFVGGRTSPRRSTSARRGTAIAQPPPPTETEVDYRKSPFAQCLVEFKKSGA